MKSGISACTVIKNHVDIAICEAVVLFVVVSLIQLDQRQ